MGTQLLSGLLNELSLLLGPKLKVEIPSYRFLNGLSRISSKDIPKGVCNSILGVTGWLINLPITGGVQGLVSFSFNDKKFIPGVFSGIPRLF